MLATKNIFEVEINMKRDYKLCDEGLDSLASRREVERSRGPRVCIRVLRKTKQLTALVVCTVVSLSWTILNRLFRCFGKAVPNR